MCVCVCVCATKAQKYHKLSYTTVYEVQIELINSELLTWKFCVNKFDFVGTTHGNFGMKLLHRNDKIVDNICNDDLFNTIVFTLCVGIHHYSATAVVANSKYPTASFQMFI